MKTKTNVQELQDTRSKKEQLRIANDFFNNPLPTSNGPVPANYAMRTASPDSNSDDDSLVSFVAATELIDDPVIMAKLMEQKKILMDIISVVQKHINAFSDRYGAEYKTDPALWANACSHIPFMGPSMSEDKTYAKTVTSVELGKEFLELITGVVESEGATALDSFSQFLAEQGETIAMGVQEKETGYSTLTVGICAEVYMVGNTPVFTPKIKQYGVDFYRHNTQWVGACASVDSMHIEFDYTYTSSVFNYEALEDPVTKAQFDTWIASQKSQSIAEFANFFDNLMDIDPAS